MKRFTQAEVGEVLQRIYDSEIHAQIVWLWDGGFEVYIGCLGDFEQVGSQHREIENAVSELAFRLSQTHQGSAFEKWYRELGKA